MKYSRLVFLSFAQFLPLHQAADFIFCDLPQTTVLIWWKWMIQIQAIKKV